MLVLFCLLLRTENVSTQQKSAPARAVVKVVAVPQLSSGPFLIAVEDGHFEREGIQIEYATLSHSTQTLPSLINGDIDAMLGGISPGYFNAIARGSSIRLVAGVHTPTPDECPSFAIVISNPLAKKGGISRPRDLRGLKVAGDRAAIGQFFYEILLARDGLTPDDIELVDIANSATRIELLKKGSLDVSFLGEPQLTMAIESSSAVLWMPVYNAAPNCQMTYMSFGSRLLEKDPELGKKFLLGYLRGLEQYRRGKTPRNVEILAKTTGLDPEFLKRACWSPAEKDGKIMLDFIKQVGAWCVRRGFADEDVPLEKLWDGRFLDYAHGVLQKERK